MSQIVTIPDCRNPFRVIVNGKTYEYTAGETVVVPDAVAYIIEMHNKNHTPVSIEHDPPFSLGGSYDPSAINGIPSGGKAGQILCKKSDEDYDVMWSDPVIPEQYGLVSYSQDKTITIT